MIRRHADNGLMTMISHQGPSEWVRWWDHGLWTITQLDKNVCNQNAIPNLKRQSGDGRGRRGDWGVPEDGVGGVGSLAATWKCVCFRTRHVKQDKGGKRGQGERTEAQLEVTT